ncbi:DUF2946 family protein [Hydrogenophaga sp. RWCD_12]|uniref:DUF2946 family protein n=1 Tax=Hydrogenophaga sp. RWCD_12 TaxID=3391190 RepID=UPI00398477A7
MSFLHWHRLARRLSGWLLAALLLATLAPAISRALAGGPPQDGKDWVELCTSQGMQRVQVAAVAPHSLADPSQPQSGALDLCGHCSLAAERFAPLLPTLPVFAVVATRWDLPDHREAVSLSSSGPQPSARGPPLLS